MAGIPPITSYPLPTAGELPGNTADWTVDPDRAVLLVHDMQRYFLKPLPGDLRESLVHHAVQVREFAARHGIPTYYTAQPGSMSEADRGLLKDFWGPGMRADPADREIVEPLAPRDGDTVLTKWRYSAFFRTDLLDRIRSAGRDQLIIVGVYAHVGILASAVEAFTHDIQPFLVADAIADFSAEDHWMTVRYAASRCAVVTTAKEVTA
ncbi:isochorismatase family protein [Streptomyces sp. NPDC101132]|uniref:isochorismatase family protein n=1 Tax=Streptomyces sp. NPDC101132 TaxID=3366110 RepID=UPI0037F96626